MRTLLPILLLLAAAGGAYVLFIDDDVSTSDNALEGEGLRDRPDAGANTLRTEKQTVVGVWGQGGGTPTRPIDYASVHRRVLRPASVSGRVTGAAILEAFEKGLGLDAPIRFAKEGSLEDFRVASLEMDDPGSVEMLDVVEWVRHMGFHIEQQPAFLLITRKVAPRPPPEQAAPLPPPPKPSVWNQPPARSDGK